MRLERLKLASSSGTSTASLMVTSPTTSPDATATTAVPRSSAAPNSSLMSDELGMPEMSRLTPSASRSAASRTSKLSFKACLREERQERRQPMSRRVLPGFTFP